jgi:hypothetical protein
VLVGWNKCTGCDAVLKKYCWEYAMKIPEANQIRLASLSSWVSLFVGFYFFDYGLLADHRMPFGPAACGVISVLSAFAVANIVTAAIFRPWGKNKIRPFFYFMDWLTRTPRDEEE